jgi:hypothetical protein
MQNAYRTLTPSHILFDMKDFNGLVCSRIDYAASRYDYKSVHCLITAILKRSVSF